MTAIPVGGIVDLLGVPATVERYTTAATINAQGRPVVAAPTLVSMAVVGHQATAQQVERAGLDHATDWYAFTAREALRVAGASGPGDVVQWEGERYLLTALENYGTLGGVWIALGKRIE